jgi:hypothetical protein
VTTREPTDEDFQNAYDRFGGQAASIVNEGEEVDPQVFFVSLGPAPCSYEFMALDPRLVEYMHRTSLGKEQMMELIRLTLQGSGPIAAAAREKWGRPPELAVHITEAWGVKGPDEPEVAPSKHPERREFLMVHVHSKLVTRGWSSMIEGTGKARRVKLAPLPPLDGQRWLEGRMTVEGEEPAARH